jgi:LacI family transcriptional regulator
VKSTSAAEPIKQIAFAFPRGSHQEIFIEGVFRYARENQRRWSFVMAPEWNAVSLRHLVGWSGDGVIAALNTPAEAACAAAFHLPIVNISGTMAQSPVPRSMVDNYAVGVMAAEHLLQQRFLSFGFYGMRNLTYSNGRMRGFRERLEMNGVKPAVLTLSSSFSIRGNAWAKQHLQLAEWLTGLEKPCAVFAASDARARQVINACEHLGLRVPEQLAVIGVDDQQVICEHVHPTITSIARNNVLEGYAASGILDSMMTEGRVARRERLIAPLRVVPRESTATIGVADKRLREAIIYFQQHISDSLTVEELCGQVGVSRRWLEYSFRSALQAGPHEFMQRERLNHARRLLVDEPTLRINCVAKRVGIESAKHFTKAFRREFGISPREYRITTRVEALSSCHG